MEEYMNSALERFFNKIEFTQKEAFKNVSVEKVVVNNKKQTWTVYLKTNTPISDIKALYDLINLAHEGLEEVFDISILIHFLYCNCIKLLLKSLLMSNKKCNR